jgi:sterol desaturase/sphingolipid hydroxylase (fatty acid hydroxylase superfamily)
MLSIFLTLLISYIFISFFGYLAHWALHQKWMGFFNIAHMTHHLKMYPPEDYTSDVYRHAGKDSTPRYFIGLVSPLIIGPIILGILGVLPFSVVAVILGMEAALGFLHNYIHDTFHINNHWMNRIPVLRDIFHKWNRLHYLHHVDMRKNYGIFLFHWDRILGTFWKSN